jgi:hypothetical protein
MDIIAYIKNDVFTDQNRTAQLQFKNIWELISTRWRESL